WHGAERFEDFCRYVEEDIERNESGRAGGGWKGDYRKRATRGLGLIRYMRRGEDVDRIETGFPGEDSFVFHRLLFYWRRHEERLAAKEAASRDALEAAKAMDPDDVEHID